MPQLPTQPVSIGRIFLTSLHSWPTVFKKTWLLSLLLFIWLALPFLFQPSLNTYDPFALAKQIEEKWWWAIIYLLGFMVFYVAAFYRTGKVLNQQPSSFGGALSIGLKRLWVMILAFIFCGVTLAIGYMALLIPGLVMMLIFMCYFPLIIMDNLNPITAYKDCFRLVWGNWWRTFFIIAPPTLLFSLLTGALDVEGIKLIHSLQNQTWLIISVIEIVVSATYFTFYTILLAVLLRDLKLRHATQT
jgi:hypothetical protein